MTIVMHFLVIASVVMPFGGSAHRKTEEGNRQYLEGAYDDALRFYTEAQVAEPHAAELYYDIGNVLFRQEDFEGAAEAYTRALLSAPDELVGSAAYNLGNSRFRLEEYGEAVKAYERALRADSGDVDAKRNLELALRAQEQQPQQQQQQQQDESGEDEQQEQEQGQQGEPEEQEQERDGQQGEGDQAEQQEEDSSDPSAGEEGSQEPQEEQQPGRMTPDQAERLLEGVEEEELDNLRKQALQKARRTRRTSEQDW